MLLAMVRRLMLVGAALLTSLIACVAAAAGQAPLLPTVEIGLRCPQNELAVTIDNPTAVSYQVLVEVGPDGQPSTSSQSVTVGPTSSEVVVLPVTATPVEVQVTGDGDFPASTFGPLFGCGERRDFAATTAENTPVEIDLMGPCSAAAESAHGLVEQVDNFVVRYIPDPGFVGVDTFDYGCTTSAEQFGTVTITVTPVETPPADPVPPPAEPVPDGPAFTG